MAADETSGTRPAPVVLRIKLRYDDVDAMVQRFAANVGKSGIFLPTKSIQPIGSEIKFELRLIDDKVVVVGLGRVKAARAPDPADPKAAFGIAVELLRVTRESRALILKMLERRRQLGLGDIAMPMPEDVDAARRADVDTSVREPIPTAIPAETASGEASVFTAPRRASGPIAVAKEYPVQPLAPEPTKRPRPRISELIAQTRSGPVAAVAVPELDESVDVAGALVRARALTSGDLDKDLASILDQAAAPVEIGIEAASAELARQLGGKPVARRERSAPGARWARPPSVDVRDSGSEPVVMRAPIEEVSAKVEAEAKVVEPEANAADAAPKVIEVPAHVEPAEVVAKVVEVPDHVEAARDDVRVEAPVADATIDVEAHAAEPRLPTLPEDSVDLALDAIVAKSEPPRRPTPIPPRLQSEPRLLAGAELEVEEALSALRAATADPEGEAVAEPVAAEPVAAEPVAAEPVAPEPVHETDPFPRIEAIHDAAEDPAERESLPRFVAAKSEEIHTERGEPRRKGTLDRVVDELEFEGDRTSVGAMPDPHAFDHHAYATEPAVTDEMSDRLDRDLAAAEVEADADLAIAMAAAQPLPDDEEFEIEEISDFEIIAEADAEDADLLAADGERDAGHVIPDEVSDFSIPDRPSQDFASRLALDDEDDDFGDGQVGHVPHHEFDRSDVHAIEPHVSEDASAISYIGESPHQVPYDPLSHSYTETTDAPEDSLEFDAPHQFARKRSHDHELESALKDLEPDLDELAPPYAGAGEAVRQRVSAGTPPKPSEPVGRQHPRAGTEDGILIDFDDDE